MVENIVIISNKYDIHTDSVIEFLKQKGEKIIRINSEDFRENSLFFSDGKWHIKTKENREIQPENIKSIYIRRIAPILSEDIKNEYKKFVTDEALVVLDYFLFALEKNKCMDALSRRKIASNKIIQLEEAKKIGLEIPDYLITNIPDKAFNFLKNRKNVLYKTLSVPLIDFGEEEGMINTSLITKENFFEQKNSITATPCLFQEYIEKKYELRLHVIGEKIIPIKIDSQKHEETMIDWRKKQDLEMFSNHEIPKTIETKIKQLIKKFGLNFGIIDMIVTNKDKHIFLELNPNGNWLFIESKINTPISFLIAEWLSTKK